ncbi:hypothetical protein KFK09_009485 [Dendrobium nobile]|uniref:Uncharacterized protein n=1 Tax=Dendrobium nobile TaxID=94219 RepID=A0A8T3BLJ9_DENNO|nr:hypothetical protein KFK09_009485 [Dendrobium nobile]
MIKRRFYKIEHGDNSGSSESSSSDDSDSFTEVEAEEDHEVEEEEEQEENERGRGNDDNTLRCPSPGSGYESEDSSNNEGDDDTSDLLTNEENASGGNIKVSMTVGKVPDNEVEIAPEMTGMTIDPNYLVQTDISNFILKFKSVFKCRLCPRVLCLNEDTVRTHLSSKRHSRSKKLHDEGRLKLMLNSDGELEEEQETHAERHARILAVSQKPNPPKNKDNGRQRQNKRRKKRMRTVSNEGKSEPSIKNCSKKRRTVDN